MAQQERVNMALEEDPSSVPSTHAQWNPSTLDGTPAPRAPSPEVSADTGTHVHKLTSYTYM